MLISHFCRSRDHLVSPASERQFSDIISKLEMPQKTLALDGLWYSLCPSFNLISLTRPRFLFHAGRHAFNRHTLQAVRDASITLPPKCRYSTAREARDDSRSGNPPINENEPIHPQSCQQAQPDKHPDPPQDGTPTPLGTPEQSRTRKYRARRSGPYRSPRVPSYSAKTTSFLEWRLQQVATKMPSVVKAINILRVLVGERHIRPDVRHYRALILANSDPEHGSADQVRTLLAEMEPNGIPVDSGTLHAALQV